MAKTKRTVAEATKIIKGLLSLVDGLADMIGEGVHTGLRKGTDEPDSHKLWKAISDSKTMAWSEAAQFCAVGIEYSFQREVDAARDFVGGKK